MDGWAHLGWTFHRGRIFCNAGVPDNDVQQPALLLTRWPTGVAASSHPSFIRRAAINAATFGAG